MVSLGSLKRSVRSISTDTTVLITYTLLMVFTAKDGSESRLHHTFNVRHNDTWVWMIEYLKALIVGMKHHIHRHRHGPGQ